MPNPQLWRETVPVHLEGLKDHSRSLPDVFLPSQTLMRPTTAWHVVDIKTADCWQADDRRDTVSMVCSTSLSSPFHPSKQIAPKRADAALLVYAVFKHSSRDSAVCPLFVPFHSFPFALMATHHTHIHTQTHMDNCTRLA